MKKKNRVYWIIGIFAFLALLLVLNWFHVFNVVSCNPFAGEAKLSYRGNTNIAVSAEDSARLRELLYGKGLYYDNPSCGFLEENAIVFGGDVFLPAGDGDPIVQNCGKYLSLSEAENYELHAILAEYGFTFPCV